MTATKGVQYALVGLQLVVLALFVAMAFQKARTATSPRAMDFSWSWLNPFAVQSFGAFTAGLSLSIFMYWGWDACLATNEETTGSDEDPRPRRAHRDGRPGRLLPGHRHRRPDGRRLRRQGPRPRQPGHLRQRLRRPRRPRHGPGLGILLFVAVLASAAASLQTTFIPVARTVLAMSTYEALPPSYAKVHPRFKTPGRATVMAGVATGVFYTVMTLVSENVLTDTIFALGLMICFYYSLTAFACAWYFRGELPAPPATSSSRASSRSSAASLLAAVFFKTLVRHVEPGLRLRLLGPRRRLRLRHRRRPAGPRPGASCWSPSAAARPSSAARS